VAFTRIIAVIAVAWAGPALAQSPEPGAARQLEVPQQATLEVVTDPPGAKVQVERVGGGGAYFTLRSPAKVDLQLGHLYQLTLEAKGFRTHYETVVMDESMFVVRVVRSLRPLAAPVWVKVSSEHAWQAVIYAGAQEIGRGGFARANLPIGKHQIRATINGEDCGEPVSVELEPGLGRSLEIRCKDAALASKPVDEPPPTQPVCASDSNIDKGFVTIDTVPPANIYHQGRLIGQTPLSRVPFSPGCIELTATAINGQRSKSVVLTVRPNKVLRYKLTL
jgi:hypothetical protein